MLLVITTTAVGRHKLDHLAIHSTTAVAAEARVNPALSAIAVVEIMVKCLFLYLLTVLKHYLLRPVHL